MKFREFESKVQEEVRKFLETWVEENRINPDEYPMEMREPDWWEQFIVAMQD